MNDQAPPDRTTENIEYPEIINENELEDRPAESTQSSTLFRKSLNSEENNQASSQNLKQSCQDIKKPFESKTDFFGQPIRNRYVYSLRADVFEFMDTTTIHALGNIARHNSIPLRIFITLCLLASLAACIWQIVVAVTNYLSYEVLTTTSTQFEAPTEFPMVTFCNLNPYNMESAYYYIHEFSDDGTVVPENYTTTIEYVNRVTDYFLYQMIQNNSLASQAYTDACRPNKTHNEDDDYYYYYYYYQDEPDVNDRSAVEFTNLTSNTSCYENPGNGYANQELGFDINQMLISCRFQNEPCSADDFIFYYDYYFGNCYRFNSGKMINGSNKSILKTGKPGMRFGLQLELYAGNPTNQEEYSVNRGFRVVVLNRTFTQQMIEDFGVDVSVGEATSITVNRLFVNHLPSPYSNCLDNDPSNVNWNQNDVLKFMYNYFIKGNTYSNGNWTWNWDVKYSQYICVNMCYQKYLFSTCGCFDITLPKARASSTYIINKACSNRTSQDCRINASDTFYSSDTLIGECYNKCPIECQEQKYILSTSVSQYPTRWYANLLNRNPSFNSAINYGMSATVNYTGDYESLKDSIAHVYVYYEDMLYSQIDETPAMQALDLVSYLGGLTGLFLGASLLSIIEPFVVVYNLIYHKICLLFALYMNKTHRPESKIQQSKTELDVESIDGDSLDTEISCEKPRILSNHVRRQEFKRETY